MDTESFVVRRAELVAQLQARRERDLGTYPFRMIEEYGVRLPAWARLGLSFISKGGAMSRLLEMGLPLAIPLIFRRKMSFVDRLVQRLFTSKS